MQSVLVHAACYCCAQMATFSPRAIPVCDECLGRARKLLALAKLRHLRISVHCPQCGCEKMHLGPPPPDVELEVL